MFLDLNGWESEINGYKSNILNTMNPGTFMNQEKYIYLSDLFITLFSTKNTSTKL